MLEYFTRENITMALAIFGSLGTIFCAIYYLVTHKVKVKINVTGYRLTNTSLLLYVTFTSKSARPIAITDISFKHADKSFYAFKNPIVVHRTTFKQNDQLINYKEFYNETFPIPISAYGGTSGYIYFAFPHRHDLNTATNLNFVCSTNRHRKITTKLQLNEVELLN